MGEAGGEKSAAGADLERTLAAHRRERLEDPAFERRHQHELAVADRDRARPRTRRRRYASGTNFSRGTAASVIEHARIEHVPGPDLLFDHLPAGGFGSGVHRIHYGESRRASVQAWDMLPKAAQSNEIDGPRAADSKGMTGLMTVPMIAAVALAILAAVLAVFAWRQRQRLAQLQDRDAPARPSGPGGDAARAMLAALREPALLHGERIEAVNDAFATLVGMPAAELTGKTLSELVSSRIR